MKFASFASRDAAGAILAHGIRVGGKKWKKGRRLSGDDCAALLAADIPQVVAALPDAGDVPEDEAAHRIAAVFRGEHIQHGKAFTGRVNIFAAADGLLCYDTDHIHQLNRLSPHITAATLPPYTPVQQDELLATIKIIPFAVAESLLARCPRQLPFTVRPFTRRRVGLIQTMMDFTASVAADKTRRVTDNRLAAFSAYIVAEQRVAHKQKAVRAAIEQMRAESPQVLLIAGAQAVSDAGDVVPAAVVAAGGQLVRLGLPVDPGNLLVLAQIGDMPVIGLPGCAKSPKINGFDWVLNRVLADTMPTAAELARWGVGGLLADTGERPQPRQQAPPLRLAALLLAAGAARRMRGENKLLLPWRGRPLLLHAAATIAQAQAQGLIQHVVAVTGRDAAAVAQRLPASFNVAHNPDYAAGMASSLCRGIRALREQSPASDAVLIFLADMPSVSLEDIRCIAAAACGSGADIIVPQHRGKRGNPVLLRRRLFPRLLQLSGDSGARALFGQAALDTVAAGSGILYDVDTPQDFAAEPALRHDERDSG